MRLVVLVRRQVPLTFAEEKIADAGIPLFKLLKADFAIDYPRREPRGAGRRAVGAELATLQLMRETVV